MNVVNQSLEEVGGGIELRLSEHLLDLDKKVTVTVNGNELPILPSLDERADLPAAATAVITLP